MDGRGTWAWPPVHQDSTRCKTRSSSDSRGEDEAETLEDDVVRVDRAVTKEAEESGEFRRESSSIYLSMSSKNSNIPSWYIAITKDPSISRYTSRTRRERTVC